MTGPRGDVNAPSLSGLRNDANLRFPARPRIIEDLRIFQMPDGLGLQLHFGDTPVVLRGRLAEKSFAFLHEYLDGSRDLDDLASAVPLDLPLATISRTLWLLHAKGLLVDGGATSSPPSDPVIGRQSLFWGRHLGITRAADSAQVVQRRLNQAIIVVVATGLFGASTADLLMRTGCSNVKMLAWDDDAQIVDAPASAPQEPIAIERGGPSTLDAAAEVVRNWAIDADLIVTATRNAPNQLFDAVNRISLRAGTPWLRGNLEASSIELGPYVHPNSSACFTCLQLRRRSTDPLAIERELDHADRAERPSPDGIPPIGEALFGATLGASHLTGEVVRIITGIAMPTLLNRVVTLSPITGEQRANMILRVPRCPECSRSPVPLAEMADA